MSARGGFGLMGRYGSVYIARPSIRNKFHWDNGLPKRGRTTQPGCSDGGLNQVDLGTAVYHSVLSSGWRPFLAPEDPCNSACGLMRPGTAEGLRPAKDAGHQDDTVADGIKSYSGLEIGVGPRPIVCNGPSRGRGSRCARRVFEGRDASTPPEFRFAALRLRSAGHCSGRHTTR